jgi:hypothetical protein
VFFPLIQSSVGGLRNECPCLFQYSKKFSSFDFKKEENNILILELSINNFKISNTTIGVSRSPTVFRLSQVHLPILSDNPFHSQIAPAGAEPSFDAWWEKGWMLLFREMHARD